MNSGDHQTVQPTKFIRSVQSKAKRHSAITFRFHFSKVLYQPSAMAPISKIFSIAALALLAASPALAAPVATHEVAVRQLAGEGAAFNALFSDTDNGVGYGIENAEDNTADNIRKLKGGSIPSGSGSSTGGSQPPPPPPPPHKRQMDKIANGFGNVANAAGLDVVGDPVVQYGDSVDGALTSGAANAGQQVGSSEEGFLEGIGKAIPKH